MQRSPRPKDGTVIVWDVTSGAATRELSSELSRLFISATLKTPLHTLSRIPPWGGPRVHGVLLSLALVESILEATAEYGAARI